MQSEFMQDETAHVLEARNLSYGYRKSSPVFESVNLSIAAGERIALVGPSGCGKSTLSQILAGYLRPDSGEVLIDGQAVNPTTFSGKVYPVQLIYQHPEKAVNPRWKLGRTLEEAWSPPPELLDRMGIKTQWLARYPAELSGGELQRFCIARALAPQTRFLIADEMSTMLDVITQAQVWEVILDEVKQRKLGLLTITHSIELAEKVSTSIVLFEDLLRRGQ